MLAQIEPETVSIFPHCGDRISPIIPRTRPRISDIDFTRSHDAHDIPSSTIHDLRNILAVLNSGAHLLRAPATPERREMLLAAIEQAAATAEQLTSALVNPAARARPHIERVDLAVRLPRLALLCKAALPDNIDLVLDLAPGLRPVESNAAELETAVLNLILNASDAMPMGGRLTVRVRNRGLDRLSVLVADHGSGMARATCARAGTARFTTKSGSGHGLGLTQVARFARTAGARFSLRSKVGRGTVVLLDLPAASHRRIARPVIAARGARA